MVTPTAGKVCLVQATDDGIKMFGMQEIMGNKIRKVNVSFNLVTGH
jgi:hypothetical protein